MKNSIAIIIKNKIEVDEVQLKGEYNIYKNQNNTSLESRINNYSSDKANNNFQPETSKGDDGVKSIKKILLNTVPNKFNHDNETLKKIKNWKNDNGPAQSHSNPDNESDSENDEIVRKKSVNVMGNRKRKTKSKANYFIEETKPNSFSSLEHQLTNKKDDDKKAIQIFQIKNQNYNQNLFIKILWNSLSNIFMLINKSAKLKYEFEFELKDYYIKNLYGISINKLKEILESNIYGAFIGNFLENNSKEKQDNKDMIESLLNIEKEDKKAKIKLFSLILNTNIEKIVQNYIQDYPYIKYGEAKLYLKGFTTFKNEFNEFSIEEKEEIKNNFSNFISSLKVFTQEDTCEDYNIQENKKEIELPESNNININEENHSPKPKTSKKRSKTNKKNDKLDNERRKMLNRYKNNFDSFISAEYYKYIKNDLLNIKSQIGYNIEEYRQFLDQYLIDIYSKSRPSNVDTECKENPLAYTYNIHKTIEMEKNDKTAKIKMEVIENNGNKIKNNLEGFKTYNNCKIKGSKELKKKYKEDLLKILDGKKKGKKSIKAGNKELLGKKRKRNNK